MPRRIAIGTVIVALSWMPSAFAQTPAPGRAIDTWSGLIFFCEADAKLGTPADLCAGVNAEAARQAAAAKIKFVALAPGDGDSGKASKAKAAGFDDNRAIEMRIRLRPPHSRSRAAIIDLDALSRADPVPPQAAGQPQMFRKIYVQGADLDANPNWDRQVVRVVKVMLEGFFETYSVPVSKK